MSTTFFVLLFIFVSNVISSEPEIYRSTSHLHRDVNDTAELNCAVRNKQDFKLQWAKLPENGPSITIAVDGDSIVPDSRITARKSGDNFWLGIKNISTSDAGQYKCSLAINANREISKTLFLDVHTPPTILENTTSIVDTAVNNSTKLECYVTGNPPPSVVWSREDSKPLPAGSTLSDAQILRIERVRKEDAGTYYCTATNTVGRSVRKIYKLNVQYPPEIQVNRPKIGQALHHMAELECTVSAFPDPSITWKKNNAPIIMTQHYKLLRSTQPNAVSVSKLQITAVDDSQYGIYGCEANNYLGQANATIQFYETSEPEFFTGGSAFNHPNFKSIMIASLILTVFFM